MTPRKRKKNKSMATFTQTNKFLKSATQTDGQNEAAAQAVVQAIGEEVAAQRDLTLTSSSASLALGELVFEWTFTTSAEVDEAYPTTALREEWMTGAMAGAVQGKLGLGRLTEETFT
jgi:hypothetical protein